MPTIGDRIKEKRVSKHLTQVELAKKLGYSKQNINRYEANIITNIPLDKVMEIANALDTTPGYLMGWEDSFSSEVTDGHDEFVKQFAKNYCKLSPERKKDMQKLLIFMYPELELDRQKTL